jgi:hypothetical protein
MAEDKSSIGWLLRIVGWLAKYSQSRPYPFSPKWLHEAMTWKRESAQSPPLLGTALASSTTCRSNPTGCSPRPSSFVPLHGSWQSITCLDIIGLSQMLFFPDRQCDVARSNDGLRQPHKKGKRQKVEELTPKPYSPYKGASASLPRTRLRNNKFAPVQHKFKHGSNIRMPNKSGVHGGARSRPTLSDCGRIRGASERSTNFTIAIPQESVLDERTSRRLYQLASP